MSELYFRTGETEGFTSKKLADKKSGYANPIRELMQNSLDASNETNNEKCEINIYIGSINKSDIPHIEEYQTTLEQAISFHKKKNSYNYNAEQIVGAIQQELENDKLGILMFIDNGKGMFPDILNGLIGERSVKLSEGSGGSFGVGHLSPYFLSSLRYVLYASKYDSNGVIKTLFSGVPILAGFEDDEAERGSTGRILASIPENEKKPNFIFPTKYPDFIQEKMDGVDTGSMVAVLGLNKNWDNKANYAIVSNFFYAINKNELTININRGDVPVSIEKADIDRLLEEQKDKKIATGDNILSGQDTYQSWLAVKDDDCKKEVTLSNGEKICVHIKNNIGSASVITLIRNGMLIARHDKMLSSDINNLRKNEDFEPFSIVINVDEQDCPRFFELVKGAEGPYHDKLEKNRLTKNIKDEKQLKNLFKELSQQIQDGFLKKRDRSGSLVSMPLLEIPNKAETQGANTNRPRSQKPKAQATRQKQKQPINKIKKTNNGKKRPAPVIISRSLDSTNAVKYKDNGNIFTVSLDVVPKKMEAKDEVYLSISLAQDSDKNEAAPGLNFIGLSIDGEDVDIPDYIESKEEDGVMKKEKADKSQVKLGKLSETQTYNIVATVEKPREITGVGVALVPFLGLKQAKR